MSEAICFLNPGLLHAYADFAREVLLGAYTVVLTSLGGTIEVWYWDLERGAFCRLQGIMA